MREQIAGPVRGYHVAIYATEAADASGRYVSYYKICTARPDSYWEAQCLVKGTPGGDYGTLDQALEEAEEEARFELCNMPELELLRAVQATRKFKVPLSWLRALGPEQAGVLPA